MLLRGKHIYKTERIEYLASQRKTRDPVREAGLHQRHVSWGSKLRREKKEHERLSSVNGVPMQVDREIK
jgi:hypothetical protein